MSSLLMLIGDPERARNDNHRRLPGAFERAGLKVIVLDHDQLQIRSNRLLAGDRPIDEYDLVWPLGFGRQSTFFDRMQMLGALPTTRFVTSPRALLDLHGKHRWHDLMPETHTSTRPEVLAAAVARGGHWVLKPTAGSYGRDVQLIRAGEDGAPIEALSRELDGAYLMVQRFIPEIREGEKRTLVAGGAIVASYLRRPDPGTDEGLLSNLAAGGIPEATMLTPEEVNLIAPVARELANLGAGFAAIDTVYPYLMEINIANPGGLETLERLGQAGIDDLAVQSILEWTASRSATAAGSASC